MDSRSYSLLMKKETVDRLFFWFSLNDGDTLVI